ncbi:lipopolysaccharide biosynthesis protein [Maribacter sp. BPC-D8]|uniref:lipopolysaccharide biosynthesis protein n=1 Tax=Maribacter sp. BPC-D8 TaxID=3053613 RepID=UPI002B4A52F7|nr:lipopolysaccharide biosynthesis protein [Maribacter sp. BPC-D8]WRI31281.1 lipopolysaccharide biosynthesis protein [Maribacter sp. BPC-D8]
MSFKKKAINGFSWTIFEGIFSQGSVFLVGIVLARLLSPKDFGLVGIITAIITVANSVVEAGFGTALIRKIDATENDFNTVFYTNLLTACVLYFILYITAPSIASFFETPSLNELIKVSGVVLIINAVSLIQRTLLTKILEFKKLGFIAIISSIISGAIAIFMAYSNFEIWSLIAFFILRPFITTILLWLFASWIPKLIFSLESFKELFDYGYKLLIGNLINTAYKNAYYFIIGKFFTPIALGFYTRADQFQTPFSTNIAVAIRRISFPILSNFQNDQKNLKAKFVQFMRYSMFLNFTIMLSIAAMAEPIILLLIGEKWRQSIIYLQLLCIPGLLYPLQILHLNLLLVKGYSNLNLKLEIIKKIILVPIILVTINYSIKHMIWGLVIFSIIEYFINSFYTKKIIKYDLKNQIKDAIPFILIALTTSSVMYAISYLTNLPYHLLVLLQLITGLFVFLITNEVFKTNEYLTMKVKVITIFKKIKDGK